MHDHFSPYELDLLSRGLARIYRGRLIPVMRGGDGTEDEPDEAVFPVLPDDAESLSTEELEAFVADAGAVLDEVAAAPETFVNADYTSADLIADARATYESRKAAKAILAARVEETPVEDEPVEEAPAEDAPTEFSELTELAALANDDEDEPEEQDEPDEPLVASVDPEPVPIPAPAVKPTLRRPARSRQSRPRQSEPQVALTAAAGAVGIREGAVFENEKMIADAMIARRREFGVIPRDLRGEKVPIATADWSDEYPEDRRLTQDVVRNQALVAAATDHKLIRAEMDRRKKMMQEGVLVAAGTICAPVTPYYNLQMLSVADRPVRGGLATFGADRGGIRFAPPPHLSVIDDAVGSKTAVEDAAGGTFEVKGCQDVVCPEFEEVDIDFIYHCLRFKNLTARTFPELVAHWNNLTLAAQARFAETKLLTAMDAASTSVDAGNLGLGVSASLPGQILAARAGLISRHRMRQDTVMRVMLPSWVVPLFISDVIRTQFQRFDTDAAKVVALLRSLDIEPTFYVDGAEGAGQVFGEQEEGDLLGFPDTARWYMFPEGSFLFLDGGTLELGLVRDSILNATNNYQIFGETFENLAFIGIESLAVTSTICDSGAVSIPVEVGCPIDYTPAT